MHCRAESAHTSIWCGLWGLQPVDVWLSRVALTVCVRGFVLMQTKTKDLDSEYGLKLRDQVLQALYAKRVAAEASQPSLESA